MIPSHTATRWLATAAASMLLVVCSPRPTLAQVNPPTFAAADPPMTFDDARIPPDAEALLTTEAAFSGDERIDALATAYRWPVTTVTYSFYKDSVNGGKYYGTETGIREVSDAIKQNVRAIMAMYTSIMNVTFTEVAETSSEIGQIRFMLSPAATYAYAYYPSSTAVFHVSGDVHLNPLYDRTGDTNGFQNPAGEHGYSALVHEIGHALGLKHPHNGTVILSPSIDNNTNTVMSYVFQGRSPATPMAFDVLALQYIYGARPIRTSEDVYVFRRSDVDQFASGNQVFLSPSNGGKQVLWDAGGYNTLDFSAVTSASGYRIDARPLGWVTTTANYLSSYYYAGVTIGPGVRIQKIVNSASDDTIYANADANTFAGYAPSRATGRDVIYEASTADVVDLSLYSAAQVTQTPAGSDLVIGLGDNGSITIKNYYGGNRPTLTFGAGSIPTSSVLLSITDTRVSEGDGEVWWHWFQVKLNEPPAETVSVSWATADGTAQAPGDYVAGSGIVEFKPGETLKYVSVANVPDTVTEGDEYFRVLLSNPSVGAEIGDGEGLGLIVNDDFNTPPVKTLTASAAATPTAGLAPLVVAFSSAASTVADGTTVAYAWTFGDGGSSSEANPSRTYTTPGSYTATLTLTDSKGATASSAVLITVTAPPANKAPIAIAGGAPLAGVAPLPVSFSSAGSTDADGTIVSYAWSFGDGGTATGPAPSYTFATTGTFAVMLTVTDDKGATATATLTVVVSAPKVNTPPTAVLTASATSGVAPLAVAFSSAGSTDADGTIVSTAWTFGAGAASGDAAPTYTYATAGTFVATLTVTDDKGATDTKSVTIVVTAAPVSTATVMSVGAITMDVQAYQGGQFARAHVTVVDEHGAPIPNAAVAGRWYGLIAANAGSALTDASGRATFSSKVFFHNGAVGFTVIGVTAQGVTYDAARNVEAKASIVADKVTP